MKSTLVSYEPELISVLLTYQLSKTCWSSESVVTYDYIKYHLNQKGQCLLNKTDSIGLNQIALFHMNKTAVSECLIQMLIAQLNKMADIT